MNLNLLARSELIDNDRYILDHVFNGNIITNDNYQGLSILDKSLTVIRNFKFEHKFLATHYYFSDDRTCFLAYNENGFLHYINLLDPSFKPITLNISNVILDPQYIWDNHKFIIADYENNFFCYDVLSNQFYSLDNKIENWQSVIFKKLYYYDSSYRLLYYDWKKNIFIYRTNFNGYNKIFWKNPSKNIDIEFTSPLIDVYRAECVDNLIFLISDESVAFFYLDQEVYRIDVAKKYMTFGARLYKYNGLCYFSLLTTNIQDQKNTIIDLYGVEF